MINIHVNVSFPAKVTEVDAFEVTRGKICWANMWACCERMLNRNVESELSSYSRELRSETVIEEQNTIRQAGSCASNDLKEAEPVNFTKV